MQHEETSVKRKDKKEKNKKRKLQHAESNIDKTTEINNKKSDEKVCEKETLEIKKPLSIRQKKRAKQFKKEEEIKVKSDKSSQQNALNYLSIWYHNKSEWKFKKTKQIWIFQHLLDEDKIPDSMWSIAVEYLSSAQGNARINVNKVAMKVIEETESKKTNEDEEIVKNEKEEKKYQRARHIVQILAIN